MQTELSYLLDELSNWPDDQVITVATLKDILINSFSKAEKDEEQIVSSQDYIH